MDILDSNIWIRALTSTSRQAENLVDEARKGQREIAVNAYIYEEVVEGLKRSQKNTGPQQTVFAQTLTNCQYIHGPSQAAVSRISLKQVRSLPPIQLIGEILDIQAKDAPIVSFASIYRGNNPTIHTMDKPFSNLTPSNHNLNWLSMQYIP